MSKDLIIFYKNILGISSHDRNVNKYEERIVRKDSIYEILVKKFYYNTKDEKKKLLIFAKILEKDFYNINSIELACYIYAINYQWDKSIKLMGRIIYLENGLNVDSWIDYGHFLRKKIEFKELSVNLLLGLKDVINNYKLEEDVLQYLKNSFK